MMKFGILLALVASAYAQNVFAHVCQNESGQDKVFNEFLERGTKPLHWDQYLAQFEKGGQYAMAANPMNVIGVPGQCLYTVELFDSSNFHNTFMAVIQKDHLRKKLYLLSLTYSSTTAGGGGMSLGINTAINNGKALYEE